METRHGPAGLAVLLAAVLLSSAGMTPVFAQSYNASDNASDNAPSSDSGNPPVESSDSGSSDNSQAGAADDEFAKKLRALGWVVGPKAVPALGNASLDLPKGFRFLNPGDTRKFDELTENPAGSEDEELFAPDDLHWAAFITFSDVGYVKDDEKIDADAVLEEIRKNTAAENEERRKNGWAELEVVGWRRAPYYNTETKSLEWALNVRSTNGEAVNFLTKVLGRRGVATVVLVGGPETFDQDVAEFKRILARYTFNAGDKYSEFKPGDKVASYGLAALIAGGAAAVAAKTGLLKWLGLALAASWKFIWIPIVAAYAGFKRFARRLFRRDV